VKRRGVPGIEKERLIGPRCEKDFLIQQEGGYAIKNLTEKSAEGNPMARRRRKGVFAEKRESGRTPETRRFMREGVLI